MQQCMHGASMLSSWFRALLLTKGCFTCDMHDATLDQRKPEQRWSASAKQYQLYTDAHPSTVNVMLTLRRASTTSVSSSPYGATSTASRGPANMQWLPCA